MRSIAQLWRTTTVRLAATFTLIFVLFSVVLLGIIAWQASIQIQRQQTADIDREVRLLERIDRREGIRGIAFAIQRLANQPGPGIYYLADPAGLFLLGNIREIPDEIIVTPGVYSFEYERARPFSTGEEGEVRAGQGYALVRSTVLPSGLRVVVGRDVVERRGFTAIIVQAFLVGVGGILVFSLVAGGLTARRILRRIDTIGATSTEIMSGNLSERVPVTPRNDEFDALATNLNAMLDRIEQLLQGLKEVTDNVAHDLKTPLTRLRNQAESALRPSADDEQRRDALEATIAESERLIRTFNALLMIARAEAGAPSGAFTDVDVSAVVSDVAELYGPVAEDEGIAVETRIAPEIHLRANRELIGQAVVNLLDNAIKYRSAGERTAQRILLSVEAREGRAIILVADDGPGIPQEDRSRVLERFVRLEKSRSEPGSGLGLSLVDAVARLHGGELRLEDNEPGVRAVIDLPAGGQERRG